MTACGGRGDAQVREPRSSGGPGPGRARLATATTGEPTKRLTRTAQLRYEIHGKAFPLPVVSGTIAGQPVLMLVDTGANSHMLAGWLARKLGLPMKTQGDVGTDHVGKPIATYRVDKLKVELDEWGPLSTSTFLATEVPDVFEKLGIGAFISPQRLDEEGDSVILDLAKGELRSAWWEEAFDELSATGMELFPPDQSHACEDNGGPVKGLAFVVPSMIDSQKVRLLVDTGVHHSDVFTSTPAGQKLIPQSTVNNEPMYAISGKLSARRFRGARVTTGAFAVTTDVDLIPGAADASCPRDGVLAMDVLRSCALLFGRTQVYGRCAAPE